jgi:hypothetical protein
MRRYSWPLTAGGATGYRGSATFASRRTLSGAAPAPPTPRAHCSSRRAWPPPSPGTRPRVWHVQVRLVGRRGELVTCLGADSASPHMPFGATPAPPPPAPCCSFWRAWPPRPPERAGMGRVRRCRWPADGRWRLVGALALRCVPFGAAPVRSARFRTACMCRVRRCGWSAAAGGTSSGAVPRRSCADRTSTYDLRNPDRRA